MKEKEQLAVDVLVEDVVNHLVALVATCGVAVSVPAVMILLLSLVQEPVHVHSRNILRVGILTYLVTGACKSIILKLGFASILHELPLVGASPPLPFYLSLTDVCM